MALAQPVHMPYAAAVFAGILAGVRRARARPAYKRRSTRLYTSWQIGVGLLLLGLTSAPAASAYSCQSGATAPCHEDITMAAWRRVAEAAPEATAPLGSRGDDEALI